MKDIRDAFFEKLYNDALTNKDIVVISADADAFALRQFKKNMPDRYINIGVTEQNMINVAAGLAIGGKTVFVYSIIPFVTMRCYEQIKFNLSGMNLPVKIVGLGAGFSFGFDGPSHHGINDIAIMRSIPNMQIFNPCDELSAKLSYRKMMHCQTPSYVRLDKGEFGDIYLETDTSDLFWKYVKLEDTPDTLIVSTGYTTHLVKKCIERYRDILPKVDCIDVCQIKPFQVGHFNMYEHIIVVEENCKTGGLFSIISEQIMGTRGYKSQIHSIAIKDKEHLVYGSREFLLEQNNITVENLYNVIKGCESD